MIFGFSFLLLLIIIIFFDDWFFHFIHYIDINNNDLFYGLVIKKYIYLIKLTNILLKYNLFYGFFIRKLKL